MNTRLHMQCVQRGAGGALPPVAVEIGVLGEAFPADARGALGPAPDRDLAVVFTSFEVGRAGAPAPLLALPLPRPRGRLVTSWSDGALRISRGGRGGLFILSRVDAREQPDIDEPEGRAPA